MRARFFAAALAAFYQQIPVGHVEAGLRTYNIYSPFPEEFNRQGIGLIAKYNFAPTKLAKSNLMNEGKDVTIIASGHLVWESLQAAEALEAEGINAEVINVPTIKPLDEKTILASALKTKAVVVAEEHNAAGGLGELVAGVFAANTPVPVEFINGGDRFGQSGTPAELLKAYGLDAENIAKAAKKAINRK